MEETAVAGPRTAAGRGAQIKRCNLDLKPRGGTLVHVAVIDDEPA